MLLFLIVSVSNPVIADNGVTTAPSLEIKQTLQRAREYIRLDNGKNAYELIKNDLDRAPSVGIYLIAAESMMLMNQPEKSLAYLQLALQSTQDVADKKYILFGTAKMQMWLGQYVRAGKTYQLLLTYPLNSTEHELALAGLVKSLAYYDRPRKAYLLVPSHLTPTTPQLVIATSQASSWANWSDITKSILIKNQAITKQINLQSSLGKDLQDVQWQTKLATSPHVITPSIFYSHDSEDFNETRSKLDYTHYWSQLAQTAVGLDNIAYSQNKSYKLNARGFYVGQTVRPTRDLILQGQIEPMDYKNTSSFARSNWTPFLWDTHLTYSPNDYISLRLLALKEVIETFSAFDHRITDDQYAASIKLNPLPYVQLNGSYSRLEMSDTNSRNVYFLSSTLLLLPNYGVSATGMLREYTDQFSSPDYFSPHQYKTASFMLKLGRKLGATWHYYLDGGLGRQLIVSKPDTEAASSPTYQWGLGITGPITPWLVLSAYYADVRQASAFIDSKDYHYHYGGLSLNIMM